MQHCPACLSRNMTITNTVAADAKQSLIEYACETCGRKWAALTTDGRTWTTSIASTPPDAKRYKPF